MKIYVGNLAYDASEDDLRTAFEAFGSVAEVVVVRDQFSGQSKGFGFVEMPTQQDAEKAISNLNGTEIHGRTVRVNPARPAGERPRRDDRRPRSTGRSRF